MGGDVLACTNFVDALKVFETDDDTEGIVIIGEIGGTAELEAAEWIQTYRKRSPNPKYTFQLQSVEPSLTRTIQTHLRSYWRYKCSSR
jgi:succinyl-CoA synthetase alpha subunit